MKVRVLSLLAGATVGLGILTSAAGAATTAPGAPGSQSYFDLARKDCVGTARNTQSKVWFTVADGVLSDTYWPTVDATNVHTLQYLVTDGRTFTDLQTRDMTYRVLPDPTGMSCTIVASNPAHGYSITTTYIADPGRDAVLMRTRFHGPHRDQLYVRLDPLAGGTGGGGSQNAGGNSALLTSRGTPVAFNTNTVTNASNRDYAVPTYMALKSSDGFSTASVGYADSDSDGLKMLDLSHALTAYDSAPNGHVTLTAGLALPHNKTVNLALGFGQTEAQALSVARASAWQRFDKAWFRSEQQWAGYDYWLRRPSFKLGPAAVREYYESVNVVKASEDKTFPGAIAAGLASPWGQAVPAGNSSTGQPGGPPNYFGSYREVFARDLYEAFAGLLVAGDIDTAQDATRFLFERQQQPDGSMPRNSLENGKPAPDTGGLQLDETSYPILMDWQSGLAGDSNLYQKHVIPAADFLVAHGPSDGVERWEEQSGYSPSTIAAEIAGLTAASNIARVNGDSARARLYQATADYFARKIKDWTVTTSGPYAARYFIRLSKNGDPNEVLSYNLGNGSITDDQRRIVDQGFLELVRLGVLAASDPDVQASLKVIDSTIEATTPSGPGFYRYGTDAPGSEDGYGDCHVADSTNCTIEGKPWPTFDPGAGPKGSGNVGSGHLWPVLGGERGEYDVAAGDQSGAASFLTAMRNMTSGQGLEPEQAWEDDPVAASPFGSDPTTASIGFVKGKPAGSASPLTWAQSQYARLALALSTGRNLETPSIVTDRYVTQGMPGELPLTVTSPADGTRVSGSTVIVTGTSAAGAQIDAEGLGPAGGVAGAASTVADPTGKWALVVPTSFGSTVITVTATLGRSTGYSQLTVINQALPGTNVLTATDLTHDDNGPGTYQYPTDSSFTAGSFDLTGLKVNQDGTNVYIQVSIAKLVPTFGNNFGAQLLDVYVRNPGIASTSSNAAQPTFNYSVAPAWSERLEAQGFASPIWVGASGASLGNAQLVVDEPSQTATLIVPQSVFGTVGSGWAFAVALTGQDGFSPDQARAFAPTPQPFAFGVCAQGGTSPICSFDPTKVPKVMDTVTPQGVSQATELDPTLGPVVLQGVPVP